MSSAASEEFFRRDRRVVCRDLIGAIVNFEGKKFTIIVPEAYKENSGPHQPVKTLPAGDVFISPFMGRYPLLLIACYNDSKPGGSVRINEIVIQPQKGVRDTPLHVEGAGSVGKALGLALRANGILGRLDNGEFQLTMR